ncbi:MAG: alpha/beta hydrolase [Rhodobacteraceae bacterium]|nr:alpha/beta hydrolase [Paracoccaceae bacterium]MCY4139784.1 alpha/beta hydrolase [Paracoccaceae bacterium]
MNAETVWKIPDPVSMCEVTLDDDSITTVRRHGNPSGLRLVLSHANGLAADLYYPFWSLLAEDFDLMVYDLRNHGWNRVGARQNHNIPVLMHDHDVILEAIARRYGDEPTVGVFHSVSALISLLSFSRHLSALILFDPPLRKLTANELEFDAATERLAAQARRRGYRFRTEEEFADLLAYMPGFTRVLAGVRELMASSTLRRSPDGQGFELRCPREYEAQLMEYVRSFSPLLDLEWLPCPTKVIGADPTLSGIYLPAFEMSKVLTLNYDFLPESTHLLQLEQPAACVELLRDFLESTRLS